MSSRIFLRKTSLTDFPGKVSSVLFFSDCNLRCPWCHNWELAKGTAEGLVTFDECLTHLKKRQPVLGGVVLSGGEPCLNADLPAIIAEIKKLSLPVKLDTNGMFPAMLTKLFAKEESRPDYIAMDLKLAPWRYQNLLPALLSSDNFNPAQALVQSAAIIRKSGISHEFRSIALPIITGEDIEALASLAGDSPWHFRPFRGGSCMDPAWDNMEESAIEAGTRMESLTRAARNPGNKS